MVVVLPMLGLLVVRDISSFINAQIAAPRLTIYLKHNAQEEEV